MDDLISRAAALDAIFGCFNVMESKGIDMTVARTIAKGVLDGEPAVDAVPVVRCRDCIHCFSMDSDPLKPYDGEAYWYCDKFDTDWNVMQLDPNRFYCANGDWRGTVRLIDADALPNELFKRHVHDGEELVPMLYYDDAVKVVEDAPTIPAIPVEWIKALTNHSDLYTRGAAKWVLGCWKKEQEAQDG